MPTILGTSKQYSGFSPQSIPGLALWLDAADSSSVTVSGTNVTGVRDKSGNGVVLSSTNGYTYPNNSFNSGYGSLPSFLNTTPSTGATLGVSTSFAIPTPFTVVFVAQRAPAPTSSMYGFILDSGGSSGANRSYLWDPSGVWNSINVEQSSSSLVPSVVVTEYGSTPTFFVNGVSTLTRSSGSSFTTGGITVGNKFNLIESFPGHICEFIIYSVSLTTLQRQRVEQYLINKWLGGLPGTSSPFTYTGASQTYSVPPQVTALNVYMWGAGGGGAGTSGGTGGAGAFVSGTLPVTPGQVLTLVVGGGGTYIPYNNNNVQPGSYGGGGGSGRYGQGGGGRSAIQFTAGTDTVTAGGGGGGGDQNNSTGAPGGSATFSGTANSGSGSQGGGGASQTAGGAVGGGNKTGSGASAPSAGSQYLGGQCDDSAGSGGGGYYGGGGSANGGYNACGGGGGSSYTANLSLISGSATLGSNSTNGVLAPASSSPYYVSGVATGGTSGTSTVSARVGGSGLIVIVPVIPSFPVYTRPLQPIDIPGCVLWFDAADSSSITTSGGYITQWRDKSGNANNLSVSTGGQNALISDSSYTSQSVVSFPSGSVLITGSAISYSADQTTVFVVARLTSAGAGMVFALADDTASGNTGDYSIRYGNGYPITGDGNDIGYGGRYYVNGTNSVPTTTTIYSTYHVISSAFSGTRSGSSRVSLSSTFFSRYFIGNVAEVIVFSNALTNSQRQQVEGYLANKWGLASSLPTTQPFYKFPSSTVVGFLPTQIYGCVLWLDAADSSMITQSSGAVSLWSDKSGNGYNGTSIGSTGSTAWSSNGLNGYPTITFDGSTGSFAGTIAQNTGTTVTMFVVASMTSSSDYANTYGRLISLATPSTLDYNVATSAAFLRFNFAQAVSGYRISANLSSANITYGLPFVGTCYWDGSSNYTVVNGTSAQPVASSGNFGYTKYNIGRTAGSILQPDSVWKGNISEVLVFSNALTNSQRQQIEGYLAQKWGLTASLPTSHPYAKIPPATTTTKYIYQVFTSSGTFTGVQGVVNYLVVGGGGGGGDRHGGGGGAGGVLSGSWTASGSYNIVVGAGGAGGYDTVRGAAGAKGGDSSISGTNASITAYGGGGGGTYDGNPSGTFGSGGGGGGHNLPGIAGTTGQGNSGGAGSPSTTGGGGGGGAGGPGTDAETSTGGIGITSYSQHLLNVGYGTTFAVPTSPNVVISGGVAYIGGGGGGAANSSPGPGGSGGLGGGGRGDWNMTYISAGTPNTGGGGGGDRSLDEPSYGLPGGSGLVLLWYGV